MTATTNNNSSNINLTRKAGVIAGKSAHRQVATLKGLAPNEFFGVVSGATGNCRCVICRKPLTDALSVQKMIGPICSGKYYSDEPVISDEVLAEVLGMVAALDGRICKGPESIDPDVIEFIIANKDSSRAISNILLAWGSVNARSGNRAKVLALTPIFRRLGYPALADRLEKDRSPYRLQKEGGKIFLKVPPHEMRNLKQKLRWVTVPAEFCNEPGKKKFLVMPETSRREIWAVLCALYEGAVISIENVGVTKIPALSDADRDHLNAVDIRGPLPAPKAPVVKAPVTLFVKVKRLTSRSEVYCTPPWEAQEADRFVDFLRSLKGRKWDRVAKCWTVPSTELDKVRDAAQRLMNVGVAFI